MSEGIKTTTEFSSLVCEPAKHLLFLVTEISGFVCEPAKHLLLL